MLAKSLPLARILNGVKSDECLASRAKASTRRACRIPYNILSLIPATQGDAQIHEGGQSDMAIAYG